MDLIIILSVVLYKYETWCFSPREAQRFKVFEKREFRKINASPMREEIKGNRRKLHNYNLYSSPITIRWIE
jgi:hypothetical protein